jgi:hypothetical protein
MVICVLRVSLIIVSPFPRVSLHVKLSRDIPDINDSGSLSRLDVSGNRLCGVYTDQWGFKLGECDATGLAALTKSIGNLKELNISSNFLKAEGVKILVPALEASRSLSSLTFNGGHTEGGQWKEGDAVTIDTTMTEADFSGKNLGVAGAQILAAFIARKLFQDKGLLSSLHLGHNNIPEEQMKAIIAMDKFDVICAVPVKELKAGSITELDLAGKSLGVEGALVLATYLNASGSMSSVNLLKSSIGVDQANALVKIKESKPNLRTLCGLTLEETELDVSKQGLKPEDAVLLASDIPDMGSLSKLIFSGEESYCKPVTMEVGMTEADFSRAYLGTSGAMILVAWLEHKVQHTTQTNLD